MAATEHIGGQGPVNDKLCGSPRQLVREFLRGQMGSATGDLDSAASPQYSPRASLAKQRTHSQATVLAPTDNAFNADARLIAKNLGLASYVRAWLYFLQAGQLCGH